MRTILHALALVLLFASGTMAKRVAPAKVPPVNTGEAIVSVPHFPQGARAQNGGVLEAHHPGTKDLLWRIQIYKTKYKPGLERDVQDVFIKSLSFDKSHNLLIVSDEKGRVFVLNLKNKKVTPIL